MTTAKRTPVPAKTTTARKTQVAKKKSTPKPAVKPKPASPSLSQKIAQTKTSFSGTPHILTVPWEEKALAVKYGAKWNTSLKFFIYEGTVLPVELKPYIAQAFSLEEWIQSELRGTRRPTTVSTMSPRPHQITGINKIKSFCQQGYRGFVLADNVGLGKSITSLLGALEVAKLKNHTSANPAKLLIIAPKAVLPHWRNTIKALGTPPELRPLIINYDQSKRLLDAPAVATAAKTTRTKNRRINTNGKANINWDIIISDESHKLKNFQESQRAKAFTNIARYSDSPRAAPFIIWASATVGQNPMEVGYLAPLIGQMVNRSTLNLKTWGEWLSANGFNVKKGKVGWTWVKANLNDPYEKKIEIEKQQKKDVERISKLLFSPHSPSIRRNPKDISGWPQVQLFPVPVSLEKEAMTLYRNAWSQFREFLSLNPRGSNPMGGLAQQLRFRQKASLIRSTSTADYVETLLENGLQVCVSVEFIESLDSIKGQLEKSGWTCVEYSGRKATEQEDLRLQFQKGKADVILFTVKEAVSFHAGEQLPDGSKATITQRATVVHDVRYSGIDNTQIVGRAHRDGEQADAYFMYAQSTVEQPITRLMLERMRNLSSISGDDQSLLADIEKIINQVKV